MPRRDRRPTYLQLTILARRMACTTLDELVEWAKSCHRKGRVAQVRTWICDDCEPSYRRQMERMSRCLLSALRPQPKPTGTGSPIDTVSGFPEQTPR
jgi:hypothetical protein